MTYKLAVFCDKLRIRRWNENGITGIAVPVEPIDCHGRGYLFYISV